MSVKLLTQADVRQLSVVQEGLEIIDWWLYDSLTVTAGGTATTFKFFQQAVGTGGKTLETTNMEIASQLPAGYRFVAQKIVVHPKPAGALTAVATLTDVFNSVQNAGRMQLFIGTRPYLQTPLLNAIGGQLNGFASVTGTNNIVFAEPRTIVNCEMEYAPVIPANYSFSAQIDYDTAPALTANVTLVCQLVGKLIRPRQG